MPETKDKKPKSSAVDSRLTNMEQKLDRALELLSSPGRRASPRKKGAAAGQPGPSSDQ